MTEQHTDELGRLDHARQVAKIDYLLTRSPTPSRTEAGRIGMAAALRRLNDVIMESGDDWQYTLAQIIAQAEDT